MCSQSWDSLPIKSGQYSVQGHNVWQEPGGVELLCVEDQGQVCGWWLLWPDHSDCLLKFRLLIRIKGFTDLCLPPCTHVDLGRIGFFQPTVFWVFGDLLEKTHHDGSVLSMRVGTGNIYLAFAVLGLKEKLRNRTESSLEKGSGSPPISWWKYSGCPKVLCQRCSIHLQQWSLHLCVWISWRTCWKQMTQPHPQFPNLQVCGGAWEFAFLTNAQVMLMLLVWAQFLKTHKLWIIKEGFVASKICLLNNDPWDFEEGRSGHFEKWDMTLQLWGFAVGWHSWSPKC